MQRPWGQERAWYGGQWISEERAKEAEFKMKSGREAGPPHPEPVGHSQGCCSPTPSAKHSFLGEEGVSWKLRGPKPPEEGIGHATLGVGRKRSQVKTSE